MFAFATFQVTFWPDLRPKSIRVVGKIHYKLKRIAWSWEVNSEVGHERGLKWIVSEGKNERSRSEWSFQKWTILHQTVSSIFCFQLHSPTSHMSFADISALKKASTSAMLAFCSVSTILCIKNSISIIRKIRISKEYLGFSI